MRSPARNVVPGAPADTGSPADDRSLLAAISRGSQEALVALFDRTAGAVGAELTARLPVPAQRIPILAATYVEVWWLAGCRSGADPDLKHWIRRILDRRIADAHRATGRPVEGEPRPGHTELELANLLGRPIDRLWPG